MSGDSKREIGRLAIRSEGEMINAYYAMPNTMDGALLIASIRRMPCNVDRKVFDAFMETAKHAAAAILSTLPGGPVVGWTETRPAPEHERSGRA